MRTREIYAKLHEFAVAATGFKDEKVIFANQIAITRPKKPFITIAVSSFRGIGTPLEKKITNDGETRMLTSMLCNVSFQAFSDIAHSAEEILSELYAQLATELPNDIWSGLLAAGRTLKHVSAIPVAVNEQIESRAILEIEIVYMKGINYYAGVIEELEVEGTISEQEIRVKKKIS